MFSPYCRARAAVVARREIRSGEELSEYAWTPEFLPAIIACQRAQFLHRIPFSGSCNYCVCISAPGYGDGVFCHAKTTVC